MFINLYTTNLKCLALRSILNRSISTTLIRTSNSKNFYEVLELQQDCTQKDIKDSFVNLSRQHHPDMKGDSCDADFKKILEAYKVLSKPHSRANYDLALKGIYPMHYVTNDVVHRPFEEEDKRWTSPNASAEAYYGVKGIKKVSNWKIVLACVIFCCAGIIAQVFAISKSFTFKRDKLIEQSAVYNEMHKKTRAEALKNDNLTNLQNMLHRMKEGQEK